MKTQTICATVNTRLLSKASRLFTGTVEGRVIEILQNARRAGATEVAITSQDGLVTVRDNGRGIDDFAKLLDLGGSGWEREFEASEDPAGVGLFCLAPRELTIRSRGKRLTIREDGWTGAPVQIEDDPATTQGTELSFRDEAWDQELVTANAVFSGLRVIVDGAECPRPSFVSDAAAHYPPLGCRIGVSKGYEGLTDWHGKVPRSRSYGDNVLVNFHGQVVAFNFHPISDHELRYLVDLTGEPTGIRLMLPARTRLLENDAFTARYG